MRPIVLDMNDMSHSREVYEAKPHPFFSIFIYLLFAIVAIAVIWAACFKIDIIVKGTGTVLATGTTVMTMIPQEEDTYPSREYGTMTGNVEFVSADLKEKSQDGSAYYVVETAIDHGNLYNKVGEKLDLKLGMYCETKIIVEQKSVLQFLLEKMNPLKKMTMEEITGGNSDNQKKEFIEEMLCHIKNIFNSTFPAEFTK